MRFRTDPWNDSCSKRSQAPPHGDAERVPEVEGDGTHTRTNVRSTTPSYARVQELDSSIPLDVSRNSINQETPERSAASATVIRELDRLRVGGSIRGVRGKRRHGPLSVD